MAEKKPTAAERFEKLLDASKEDGSYYIEGAKVELSEQIYLAMESAGVTEAELARRIGASRAYINKVLQGSTNFTIESLVKIGRALGREFKFEFFEPKKRVAMPDQNGLTKTPPRPRRAKLGKIAGEKVVA